MLDLPSIILGGIITIVVGYFFYRKSIDTKLGIYLNFASHVISNIGDPHVRKDVNISYKGKALSDLLQLQFIIANDAQRPVKGIVDPLHVTLPENAELLDYQILHVEPPGREVKIYTRENDHGLTDIVFDFKLLNKNEFFIVKLLIDGEMEIDKLSFRITAEEIEPTLKPVREPFEKKNEILNGGPAIFVGSLQVALAVGVFSMIYHIYKAYPETWPVDKQGDANIITLVSILSAFAGLYFFFRGLYHLLAKGVFSSKPKFKIPQNLKNNNYYKSFSFDHSYIGKHRSNMTDIINDPNLTDDQKHQRLDSYVASMRAELQDHR